jgi:hypothetical protein
VTNLGQVQLSRISERLAELPGVATIVYDLAVGPGGTWYLATGPEGRVSLVKLKDLAWAAPSFYRPPISCLQI